jgi:EAL domain-containing protein (putative c-di-GMP-specific phosphodiesterase class I)
MLPEADARDAVLIVQRILAALEPPLDLEGHTINIGASIGIAVYPDHGADADTLLRRADVAMYVAKRAGNGHAIYTFEQDQNSPSRLALVGELRKAIDEGELVLYYQPKQDFRSGRITCVEALVRWQHPQYGLMSPDRFLPIAEQTGLIRPLGLWVLNTALRQCHLWAEAGLELAVAVNVSTRNLEDPNLPAIIGGLLARWEVSPDRLVVELTESSLMTNPERAEEIVRALYELGVKISVDDFGTGYSSLAYLKRLAVGELKIDKTFVQQMAVDQNDAAIVRSTVGLGHDLGLQVVAEGVEDQHTWELLAALDCDVAQGYYLSRPLSADDLVKWLADLDVMPATRPALVAGVPVTTR